MPAEDGAGAAAPLLDCVVIGGGPAGLTAGLYLHRFLRDVCIVDAGGARARRIARSHNVAGFPAGISGAQLLSRMRSQLRQVGGRVMRGRVLSLQQRPGQPFVVALGGRSLQARRVLLCTGVRDRLPALPGAAALEAAGLMRYCPICDGYEHRGRRIGVIGRSAHAVREAAFLKTFSSDVRLIALADGHDDLVLALRQAGLTALPGCPCRLDVGPGGEVVVTTGDGRRHGFDVLYAAGDVVRALDQIGVAVGQAAIAATAVHNSL